jgi:calcium-dependent protein kinase
MGNKLKHSSTIDDKNIMKAEIYKPSFYIKSEIIITPSMFVPCYYNLNPYDYYDNLNEIGYGSTGIITKVINKNTKIIRALKKIILENKKYTLEEANKEILIMKKLDHPNILKVFEYYILEEKEVYIISEYVEGEELFEQLAKIKHFNEEDTYKIMIQLFSAIKLIHDNGIIHRDIKPENIVLTNDQNLNIKLIDFGSCEIINNGKTNRKIGTPSYISPEIISGLDYDYKCDIWSLGVVMYFLLSGSTPFNGNSPNEIYDKIKKGIFTFNSNNFNNVSDEAKNLIKSMLVKDQDKRININQVINSNWVKKFDYLYLKELNIDEDYYKKIAFNLKNFTINNKIQIAYLSYLFHNNYNYNDEEMINLIKVFYSINLNHNCRLSEKELENFLEKYSLNEGNSISNKIISLFNDQNNSDKGISFEIFGLLNMNINEYINSENIQKVFKLFDNEKTGKITINSMKKLFDPNNEIIDENIWNKFFEKINLSNDNPLNFISFSKIIKEIQNK